ncbi:MAG: hypothetical protein JNN01_13530 [Opitutaceae bacterium]|nr:hypothetical protein [Opitutaceae bacterium]
MLLASAGPFAAGVAERPIRELIVNGFNYHDGRLTTALVRGILNATRT